MSDPLASLPPVPVQFKEQTSRFLRLFGPARLSQYLKHLDLMTNGPQWFVFVAPNDAKCFTRWVRPVSPVKNPRSITGNQKYIAAARNDGIIF